MRQTKINLQVKLVLITDAVATLILVRHISGGQGSIHLGWTLARTRKLKSRSKSEFIEQEIRAVGIGAVGGDSISSTDPYREVCKRPAAGKLNSLAWNASLWGIGVEELGASSFEA
ncbi:hypothetical protein R1flu_028788 [Riccia fluitans]|uniref:Uncharacterized protein n=1 Tax=Riccia fluitans TaxID=41844 RepID=A0ABD1XMR5_9MARC